MSDYPSYWTDTWVLKAIHYVLLPLAGVARIAQRLGGKIWVTNVYAGPDGVLRYIGVWRVSLLSLAQRFCDHAWVSRIPDPDAYMTYAWLDEFEGIRHEADVCRTCGTEWSREVGVSRPSRESKELLANVLRAEFPDVYESYCSQRVGSSWYIEIPVAISRILRDQTEDAARAYVRAAVGNNGPTGRTF